MFFQCVKDFELRRSLPTIDPIICMFTDLNLPFESFYRCDPKRVKEPQTGMIAMTLGVQCSVRVLFNQDVRRISNEPENPLYT